MLTLWQPQHLQLFCGKLGLDFKCLTRVLVQDPLASERRCLVDFPSASMAAERRSGLGAAVECATQVAHISGGNNKSSDVNIVIPKSSQEQSKCASEKSKNKN
ncbi:hypothetical protein ACLKA7_003544 [Drosophila subpalustris]